MRALRVEYFLSDCNMVRHYTRHCVAYALQWDERRERRISRKANWRPCWLLIKQLKFNADHKHKQQADELIMNLFLRKVRQKLFCIFQRSLHFCRAVCVCVSSTYACSFELVVFPFLRTVTIARTQKYVKIHRMKTSRDSFSTHNLLML